MGPTEINGLPAHVLLVHVVVVLVPLAALLLVLAAVWPAARRRLGLAMPIVALIALAAVPPTMNAGDWLVARVDRNAQVNTHAHLADGLLPWTIGLFVVAVALWVAHSRPGWLGQKPAPVEATPEPATGGGTATMTETATTPVTGTATWLKAARIALAVLALVVAVGSSVEVYRIGDSGAQAAWHDGFSQTPKPGSGG